MRPGACAVALVRCAACVRAASRLKGQRALRERAGARGWDRRWLPIKLPQPHPELLHLRQRVTITDWALRLGRPPPVNQEGASKAGEGQPCQRFAGNFLQLQKKLQRNKTKQKKHRVDTEVQRSGRHHSKACHNVHGQHTRTSCGPARQIVAHLKWSCG